MATKIVKTEPSSVEIVPSTDLKGIQIALANLSGETSKALNLKNTVASLSINSPEEFRVAGELLKQVRSFRKSGKNLLGTFEEIIKRASDFVKSKRLAHEQVCDEIDKIIADKMSDFTRRERIAKEAEQRRLNEEAAKANAARIEQERKDSIQRAADKRQREIEDINALLSQKKIGKRAAAEMLKQVGANEAAAIQIAEADAEEAASIPVEKQEVLSNVPAIAGLRKIRSYYAEGDDIFELLSTWFTATEAQRQYWMQFIAFKANELNAEARKVKDSAKLMQMIPGVRAWDEDSI